MNMSIPMKYGLTITAGVAIWIIVAHFLVPDPQSRVHSLGAIVFFNLLQFGAIYFGIRARGRTTGDRPAFKDALKTGISISFVYAVSSSLFFLAVVLFFGSSIMGGEPGAGTLPHWLVFVQAFTGLFLGSMFFGLIYSTLISFVLAKRLSETG
jgi:predicted permease